MTDLNSLLQKTSRTFALAIPLLPEPTVREVEIAYLLFRIADTFEDAAIWSKERRMAALDDFAALLASPSDKEARRLAQEWLRDPPTSHEGYLELLAKTPLVMEHFLQLSRQAQNIVQKHVQRTAQGMAGFVARTDQKGLLHLEELAELRDYCYVVAGIVGEMLTDLFLLGRESLSSIAPYLRQRARLFGEGLQLTNILKDAAVDHDEGRHFLPSKVEKSQIFALAHQDLGAAAEYALALQGAGAPRGVVAFSALPVLLARPTLSHVETKGPGAKLTRPELFAIISRMNYALEHNEPVLLPMA